MSKFSVVREDDKTTQAILIPKEEKETVQEQWDSEYSVYRHEWNDERNEWLSYMYEKSWYDKDMILTFLSENDNMWIDRPSNFTWFNWQRAYWICQLYYTYHKDFIESEEFKDPYKQMDYCMWVWNNAKERWIIPTTFYAYAFRQNAMKKLVFNK